MAEDETPNWVEEDKTAPPAVPSRDPLPPPPVVHFTRPNLDGRSSSSRSGKSGAAPDSEDAGSGHGAGLAAGFTFVASILAGLLAGTWLDGHFNHSGTPWWTMIMTLGGTGVGFTNMFKLLSRGGRRKP